MEYKDTKVPKRSTDEDGQPDYLVNAAWTAEDIDLIHQVKPATKNVLFKVPKAPLQRPEYLRMMKKRESERLPKQLKLNPDRASAISSNSRLEGERFDYKDYLDDTDVTMTQGKDHPDEEVSRISLPLTPTSRFRKRACIDGSTNRNSLTRKSSAYVYPFPHFGGRN